MLTKQLETIAETLETGEYLAGTEYAEEVNCFDYLDEAYSIDPVTNDDGEILGARVLVAFGGPNIWIDTAQGIIEGAWWGHRTSIKYNDGIGFDDAVREYLAS